MNGILPLWKPAGLTSHDCVAKLRRIFQTKKVGHTGTLDPEVEGVLGICIGRATRVSPFLTQMDKTYIAECSLGQATETEDAHGAVIDEKEVECFPSEAEIVDVLKTFSGEIIQVPPMYSAVKVKGKRLYEYARNNEYVERPSRTVEIYAIDLLHVDSNSHTFSFSVKCSAGTYIRTLCVDIGKALGFPAHMSQLERTEVGPFTASETITFDELEQLKETGQLAQSLVSIEDALISFDRMNVDQVTAKKVSHGQKLHVEKDSFTSDHLLVMHDEELLAIYERHPENNDMIKPYRVFV